MNEYRRNKFKTAADIVQRIENWPTAFAMRLNRQKSGLRLLNFRSGLNVICRGGTRDWEVIHELFFAGGYQRALNALQSQSDSPLVLDLGGNIGSFSLLAALSHSSCQVISFEPGPPNYRLFEMNQLANPKLADRIELRKHAVGGTTRTTEWFFDENNPGGSGLFAGGEQRFSVKIVALAEVISSLPREVALAKIDIEGAEFEILAETSAETWQRVRSIALELHDDPEGKLSQADVLARFRDFGFKSERESVVSYFLSR